MTPWLNFRQIKQAVPLAMVLQHYAWQCWRRQGHRVQGRCPIHHGQRVDAFHADLRHNGFHCFSCQAHGSVLDLVAGIERCSIRQAALWLQEWFGVEPGAAPSERNLGCELQGERIRKKEQVPGPLGFSLRPIDSEHAYLKERGIDADTAAHFGVGYYAGPGLLHGRVVIPIHDDRGQLLAYAGRSLHEAYPKYLFPARFQKSSVLFNLHRARACGQDTVIIVEGFFDSLKVYQAGRHGVVALMGCSLSAEQERLLLEHFQKTVLMMDGDLAGWQGSLRISDRLRNRCTIDVVRLSRGNQPDKMSRTEIQEVLTDAVRCGADKLKL
jgi:DNA primase